MAKNKKSRYTAKNLRRRNIRFWFCYLILLVLIVISFGVVHNYYDKALTAYESVNSDEAIANAASLFLERRFDELYEYEDKSIDYLESREDYISYLQNLTRGAEISYRETASSDPEKRAFVVTANGKSFATFTMRSTGRSAEFEILPFLGFKLKNEEYTFDSISTSILQPATYEVTIRDNDTLYVNGQILDEAYAVKTGTTLFYDGHLPEGVPSPTLTTYRFTCALGEPQIVVNDANDEPYELATEDGYRYSYEITYSDDELSAQFEEKALTCVKNIAQYTTKNRSLETVLKGMVKNSPAATQVKNMDGLWLTKADKFEFIDPLVQNYVRYADNAFSCEVSFTYKTTSKGAKRSYPVAYRLYYTLSGTDWLVYDFENF